MKPFIESGDLVMLGVIQEQHSERCRLFQQWQGLDFPVVQDLLNTNGIAVVPVYVAIDEYGIVRDLPRSPKTFANDFITKTFAPTEETAPVVESGTATAAWWQKRVDRSGSIRDLVGLADCLILWQPTLEHVQSAIEQYSKALKTAPERSDIEFRLGAANRLLYELGNQADADLFASSVNHWETALKLNPNQYIYRRRIEQYGPRLLKPYSFYDWIATARQEITARGETPFELSVEPNGAEFAERARGMDVDPSGENPDPDSQITLVEKGRVTLHSTLVPTHPKPGDVVAVHVGLNVIGAAKWNHESEPMTLWTHDPAGDIQLSSKLIRDETPHDSSESANPVSISFEIQIPESQLEPVRLTGFALFNICESEQGQCLFRRYNFEIEVPIAK